jgi:hypothetical protein
MRLESFIKVREMLRMLVEQQKQTVQNGRLVLIYKKPFVSVPVKG